jgi:hypothetical protein
MRINAPILAVADPPGNHLCGVGHIANILHFKDGD